MAPVKGLPLPPFPSFEEFLRCESTTSAVGGRTVAAALTMTNHAL
jgi:hypothetical protein